MFVRTRKASKTSGGRPAGSLFLVVVGAVIFVHLVQGYMAHMMPLVQSFKADSAYYGFSSEYLKCNASAFSQKGFGSAPIPETRQIREVVVEQLSDFRHQNFQKALRLASVDYSATDPAAFGKMVCSNFPQLVRSKTVQLGATRMSPFGVNAVQAVHIVEIDGSKYNDDYNLILEGRNWRVSSVVQETPPARLTLPNLQRDDFSTQVN